MNTETMLPLPPAVLKRLETAETLRAEVAALTTERDALREELQTAAWERDTAQNEASYLRTEMYPQDADWLTGVTKPDVGRVLTMGDEPPPAPEDDKVDIALVSISTGEVYVRSGYGGDSWAKYGESSSTRDWASLAESGPWIVVDAWRFRDHRERSEKRRKLRSAVYSASPGRAGYPEESAHNVTALTELLGNRLRNVEDEEFLASLLGAWQMLAGSVRMHWERAHTRQEKLTEFLKRTPHDPEWMQPGTPEPVCTRCLVAKPEHVARAPSQEMAVATDGD